MSGTIRVLQLLLIHVLLLLRENGSLCFPPLFNAPEASNIRTLIVFSVVIHSVRCKTYTKH